jgi:hypothetical protein
MDFFRIHCRHKGDAAMKFEALSNASQIVNERLLEYVQPAQKKQSRAHTFSRYFFQVIISLIMQPYNVLKSKRIAQCL